MKRMGLMFMAALSASIVMGQSKVVTKSDLVSTIRSCSSYACNVLLDESGKSRCDYNMINGKWYPYEEPWHTGQLILGLLEAYRVTGDAETLSYARKAGNWWIGLEIKNNPKLKGMVGATHGDEIGNDQIVFATVSDGTHGLFELSKVTGDKKYAKVASNAIGWMLEHMYYPEEGVCYDLVDLKTGEVLKQDSPFYKTKKIRHWRMFPDRIPRDRLLKMLTNLRVRVDSRMRIFYFPILLSTSRTRMEYG